MVKEKHRCGEKGSKSPLGRGIVLRWAPVWPGHPRAVEKPQTTTENQKVLLRLIVSYQDQPSTPQVLSTELGVPLSFDRCPAGVPSFMGDHSLRGSQGRKEGTGILGNFCNSWKLQMISTMKKDKLTV